MQEHSLNGVIHLFAVFASLAGTKSDEASRLVEAYLTRTLGLHHTDVYLGIFGDLLELYADGADPARGVDGICASLETHLSPADKQLFLLQALHIRHTLADSGSLADELLDRIASIFRAPADELAAYRALITATPSSADTPLCRKLSPPGWRGLVVVLYSPWTRRLFLRVLKGPVSLDENPLDPGRFYPMETGAILRDAGGQPIYRCDLERLFAPPDDQARILFEAEHVNYRFPGGEHGLHDLSFRETGGRLIGVMGGSGVGKSTLINILNGSLPPDSGRVAVNGINLYENPGALEGVVGYVPQDDLLFEDLTVRQNLDYNARLCMAHLTHEQRSERVDRMLRELNQEEIADLKVGQPLAKTISGGQRKRLNSALELIREPAVLFVDEPTSGLSSADSDIVMGLLKEQAVRGRLVIVIIHQPSSSLFRLFDALWLLDRGGYPIYMGHPLEAARHFRETAHLADADQSVCPECGNVNPEQLFSIIETKTLDADGRFSRERRYSPEFWHKAWQSSVAPTPGLAPPDTPPPRSLSRPTWRGQLATFFSRTFRARCSNRSYLLVNLLEPPLLALITAWICRSSPGGDYTFGDNPYVYVYFFMAVIVALFLGLSVSAEEIVRDRRILQRERFLHLSWSAYAGSKMAYVGLLALLQSAVCAAAGVLLLRIPGMFPALWLALFSAAVFGGFLGLNISALFKSAVTVYILIPLLLIPQMLLGGLIIAYDDLRPRNAPNAHPPLLGELMASRWAFEALVVEQFQSNEHQRHFYAVEQDLSRLDYLHSDLIPALIGRLDALYLDTASPDQRNATHALILRELSTLERERPESRGLAEAAAALHPPDRTGLDAVKSSLRALAQSLQEERDAVQRRRNEIQEHLLAGHGEEGLASHVKKYSNRKINELARNRAQLAPCRITGGRIVRLSDPVYQAPRCPIGRAPFMAGAKRVGPVVFRTYTFDMLALWMMNIALAAALAFRRRKGSPP